MIKFNIPPVTGKELDYIAEAIKNEKICGDGVFSHQCHKFLEEKFNVPKVFLTTSGTSALEMSSLLCNIEPGDEVIMPSFTFVSTADAFLVQGAVPVFVDIRPDTMNIDETKIEAAITAKTKVICVVHYAGVACDMNTIMDIAHKHNLLVVEDAAHGVNAFYQGKALGTLGDFGCFSFHETKNYSMGEGGAILINHDKDVNHAYVVREKGTDRQSFIMGHVDKYTWVDKGASYLPSDMLAAYLYAQLENIDQINHNRLKSWFLYRTLLQDLKDNGQIDWQYIPKDCVHNAHMFYIKCQDKIERQELMDYLKEHQVSSVFHYIPLHSAPAGVKYGRFVGEDKYTTKESERLLRLPMYYNLKEEDVREVCRLIHAFYITKL